MAVMNKLLKNTLKSGGLTLLYTLAACAVGPDFVAPTAPSVAHYELGGDPLETSSAKGIVQRFVPQAKIDADWWRLFKSKKLDALIEDALLNNPGLDAAEENLRQSQDNLRSGYGIFFPDLNADAGASRQRYTPIKAGEGLAPSIFNLFTLSATVSYALDLFGGERRMVEGLGAEMDMARATKQATYLALTANIANTAIAKAAYEAEIKATEDLIAMQKEQVRLAEIQEQSGMVPYSNVLSLRTQLASYQATLPQLEQKLTQSSNLLAALAGHTSSDWNATRIDLVELTLPNDLPLSLPSELVQQRPDILVAEAVAHVASANIGISTAAMLPSVTLNGSYGANSSAINNVFSAKGNFWSLGANASTPLFDGGSLWFKRKAAIDNYQQILSLYKQTVLAAFEQVADTLRALQHDAEYVEATAEALSLAKQNMNLVDANYQAGLVTNLDVLNADIQYHQALISNVQAVATRYQDTIALFTALGGGWWNEKGRDSQ